MSKHLGKNTSMLRLVEEAASSKEEKKQVSRVLEKKMSRANQVPHLPNDWIFNILLLLPIKSLLRLSSVCKTWFNLINSSTFIEAHMRCSETILIFLKSIPREMPNTFSVEANLDLAKQFSIFPSSSRLQCRSYIHFLEIQGGKGKIAGLNISCSGNILATCNGLTLLSKQNQEGLLVMNPMTRKFIGLPNGTLPYRGESYGFMFSHSASDYKVVHLFRDEMRYIGCEILNLSTRSWRAVDGPSSGLFRRFLDKPVSAIGAMHWVPDINGSDYIVSMGIDDEKFLTTPLPETSKRLDRLIEMGGFLCFATHVKLNQIELWFLKGLCGKDWIKHHIINMDYVTDLVPVFTSRNGREMFFKRARDDSFYAYDFQFQGMRNVEMEKEHISFRDSYLPHVNSLVTWTSLGAQGKR